MDEESLKLKDRIVRLSDDELLHMVTVDADQYREEALSYAKAELRARRIDTTKKEEATASEPEIVEQEVEREARTAQASVEGSACLACGGRMRAGTLVAEKELSIIFGDTREERFVRAMACSQCGQLLLMVNYDEEVEG